MLHTAWDLDSPLKQTKQWKIGGKPEAKGWLGSLKLRWEHDIKMLLKEIGSLFYVITLFCHFLLLCCCMFGLSIDWPAADINWQLILHRYSSDPAVIYIYTVLWNLWDPYLVFVVLESMFRCNSCLRVLSMHLFQCIIFCLCYWEVHKQSPTILSYFELSYELMWQRHSKVHMFVNFRGWHFDFSPPIPQITLIVRF